MSAGRSSSTTRAWAGRIQQEHGEWVSFALNQGSTGFGLYPRKALADDASVGAEGSGFGGVPLSYIVRSDDRVDAVLAEAARAGGSIVRPAERAAWGGYFGYFADPDGYLGKVAAGPGKQPFLAE